MGWGDLRWSVKDRVQEKWRELWVYRIKLGD